MIYYLRIIFIFRKKSWFFPSYFNLLKGFFSFRLLPLSTLGLHMNKGLGRNLESKTWIRLLKKKNVFPFGVIEYLLHVKNASSHCYLILLATIIKKKKLTNPLQLSFAPITFLILKIHCKYSVIKLKLRYG